MGYIRKPVSGSHKSNHVRELTPYDVAITEEKFGKLLTAIKENPVNIRNQPRDYIIMVLMGNAGLRIGEVVILQRKHMKHIGYDPASIMCPTLKQRQKDVVEKRVWMHSRVADTIQTYMDENMFKNDKFLFPGGSGNGHISKRMVRTIFYTYCHECGYQEAYRPHSIRHMYGTRIWERTNNAVFVRDQMRHSSVANVQGASIHGVSSVTDGYMHISLKEAERMLYKMGYIL